MLVIEAHIKPFKLDDVKEALDELGVAGVTVTEVMQTGDSKVRGRSFGARGGMPSDLVPKIKLEIAVPRQLAERVIEAICLHGSAGRTEDGNIVVERLETTIRIRTGEFDEAALSR
jgi:nitrogen regulatory protein PII